MNPDFPIFIFPYANPLKADQESKIFFEVNSFLSQWKAHDSPLKAKAWVEENLFLLVEVDPVIANPSGCSKDKLYHFVKKMNDNLGLQEAQLNLFFIKANNEIRTFDKKRLKIEWVNNRQMSEYQLFPIWISTQAEYQKWWGKSLSQFQQMLQLDPEKTVF